MYRSLFTPLVISVLLAVHVYSTCAADDSLSSPRPERTKKDLVLGQYAGGPRIPGTNRLDIPVLMDWMTNSSTNTFNILLWDTTGDDYLDLVLLLSTIYNQSSSSEKAKKTFPTKIWVTLIPPTEVINVTSPNSTVQKQRCSIPADSPITPFNDTLFFNPGHGYQGCTDYLAWATLLGVLRREMGFEALDAVNIDDFGTITNLYYHFPVEKTIQIRSALNAGGVKFMPTAYYADPPGNPKYFILHRYPWLLNNTDGFLFYFRNDKRGPQECRPVSQGGRCNATKDLPPTTCYMACLCGPCSEVSVANLHDEVSDMYKLLNPYGQRLVLGEYFAQYSNCPPSPSIRYNYEITRRALFHNSTREMLDGVMVYTTMPPAPVGADCEANPMESKECVVKSQFEKAL